MRLQDVKTLGDFERVEPNDQLAPELVVSSAQTQWEQIKMNLPQIAVGDDLEKVLKLLGPPRWQHIKRELVWILPKDKFLQYAAPDTTREPIFWSLQVDFDNNSKVTQIKKNGPIYFWTPPPPKNMPK